MKSAVIGLFLLSFQIVSPVINPDNVKPGDWFTPVSSEETAKKEAYRNYICSIRTSQVWPDGDCK